MSEEKSRKALRLKTLEEMKNDLVYEINLFSRKRRGQGKLSKTFDEEQFEEQVVILNSFIFIDYIPSI